MRIRLISAMGFIILFTAGYIYGQEKGSEKKQDQTGYTIGTATAGGTGKFYLGREIARVMGASNSIWLDRSSRPQEENTQLAIDKIQIPPTGVIADIGAGTGYYT